MKYCEKQEPPQSFTDWLASGTDDWQPSYGNLQNPEKSDVKIALLEEQGFVCAYCGRGLSLDLNDSHIDHFWPQEHFNAASGDDRTISYNNFVASCGPPSLPGASHFPRSCGDAKGSWFDNVNYVIPSDPLCEGRFKYLSTGTVRHVSEADLGAKNMVLALKLNDKGLMLERRQLIDAIEALIATGEITSATKTDFVLSFRSLTGKRMPTFGHVGARYLEDEPL